MKSPGPAAAEAALKAISDHFELKVIGNLMNVLIRNFIHVVFVSFLNHLLPARRPNTIF